MKLLVVTPNFYPQRGGVEEHTFQLYKGLAKKGYEIILITTKFNSQVSEFETLEGIKIYRLPYQFKIANTPISFKWLAQIKKIISLEKPDMIMAHSPVPFMADLVILTSKKIPIIFKYHSGSMKKENYLFHNTIIYLYEKFVLKKVIRKVDHLICTSDFVRDIFLPEFKYKSTTITPGVDSKFIPLEYKKNISPSILFLGRLDKNSKWKGVRHLIDAISLVKTKFPKVLLNIIGGGDDLENQKQYVKSLGLQNNIEFLGPLYEKRIIYFQKTDLFVLPSTTQAESFGMVLLEAMACKKPVIGSRIGGIPYVIDHGKDGLLVKPRCAKALADAIFKILENPALAEKMGENGYAKVINNYSWDRKVRETGELIEAVYRRWSDETDKK